MTVNQHNAGTGGWSRSDEVGTGPAAGHAPEPPPNNGFCDFHMFHRGGGPARLVIVHTEPGRGHRPAAPVVTWLEVRCSGFAPAAAAMLTDIIARRAASEATVPVRVYDHDAHGNVHSWAPDAPVHLTRERLAPGPRVPEARP